VVRDAADGERCSGQAVDFSFRVNRGKRGPASVLWERRDAFSGEDSPAIPFDWPWTSKGATAIDALGQTVPVQVSDKRLHLSVSVTPIFIEPSR